MTNGGRGEGDRTAAATTKKIMFACIMNEVVDIIFQNSKSAVLKGVADFSKLSYGMNVGAVVKALCRRLNLRWSASGEELWREAAPELKLKWRKPCSTSRKPADDAGPRQTTLGGMDADGLAHDEDARVGASAAAQRRAAEARPPLPSTIPLTPPDASDRLGKKGTGWGHVPRPLGECALSLR